MSDRLPVLTPTERQALLAFSSALIRSDDEEAEAEAIASLVAHVGAGLPAVLSGFDRVAERVRRIRHHVLPVLQLIGEAQRPAVERTEAQELPFPARPSGADADRQVRQVLDAIDRVKVIEHVAPALYEAAQRDGANIEKIPRRGSRGNGLLYVMDKYGRGEDGLSLELLVYALEVMGAVESGQDAKRVGQWEIQELIRRGWPIKRLQRSGRYLYYGPPSEDEAM